MNILCITPWFPAYAQDKRGSYILDSVKSLVDAGHNVVVLLFTPWKFPIIRFESYDKSFDLYIYRYISIPRNYLRVLSNFIYRKTAKFFLKKILNKYHFDIIHAHTELSGLAAIDAGRKNNIPTIMTLHGIDTDEKLFSNKNKYKYSDALNNVDRIILVGHPLVNYFKKLTDRHDRFRIIPNGFRINYLNAHCNKRVKLDKTLKLISVSNLQKNKGIDLNLISLYRLLRAGISNWHYTVIGSGKDEKNLKQLTDELNIKNKVSFVGDLDHSTVFKFLKTANVFILPSAPEAFGIAYLEAMSCGLLCIAVVGQGPEHFIANNETGLLIDKDTDVLFKTLIMIFNSPNYMKNIARAGRMHVRRYFTWKHHAAKLVEVYEELIKEHIDCE